MKKGSRNMSINKNDCLDCTNCTQINIYNPNSRYICSKGNKINIDDNGIVQVLDHDCKDFEYEE